MGDFAILNSALAVISLLFVATTIAFFLRNSKIPYTVVLVLVGILVGFAAEKMPLLHFLGNFQLSPALVFYVFLPTLIFESAFHMKISHFRQNIHAITWLSTVGMILSMSIIGFGLHYILHIPLLVSFLFGALISATDPIAVLALFKKTGVSKRLSTIIEGESLFNDGSALVLFGLVLEIMEEGHFGTRELFRSLTDFAWVLCGGIVVGTLMGFLFSKFLDYVKNSKEIEISITLILAHFTFILAEYFLGVSGILATVAAGIVLGNYGAYKISPSVKEIMTHFWDYSAFLANSLLFLLVGLVIFGVRSDIWPLLPSILWAIGLTLFARIVMVYTLLPLINFFFPQEKIPVAWMHVIQWSGLRGALAIALILSLPAAFPYYEELLLFTVGVIFFTLIFNGATIGPLLSLLGLQRFSPLETFEYEENKLLIDEKVKAKLQEMKEKKFISEDIFKKINDLYALDCQMSSDHIRELLDAEAHRVDHVELQNVLKRHLLGIEKQVFKKLYAHGEITQNLLIILLQNIAKQVDEGGKVALGRLTLFDPQGRFVRLLSRLGFVHVKEQMQRREVMLRYEMFRARLIAINEVLANLDDMNKSDIFPDQAVLKSFQKRYAKWRANAQKKLVVLEQEHPAYCSEIQLYLAQQAALHVEVKTLDQLGKIGSLNAKVYAKLRENLEARQDLDIL